MWARSWLWQCFSISDLLNPSGASSTNFFARLGAAIVNDIWYDGMSVLIPYIMKARQLLNGCAVVCENLFLGRLSWRLPHWPAQGVCGVRTTAPPLSENLMELNYFSATGNSNPQIVVFYPVCWVVAVSAQAENESFSEGNRGIKNAVVDNQSVVYLLGGERWYRRKSLWIRSLLWSLIMVQQW